MKRILFSMLIALTMTACCNNKNNTNCNTGCNEPSKIAGTKIPEGIIKAIDCYVEGGRQASSEAAKKGFAATATMSWSENGELRSVPIQALFDGFDSWQPTEVSYEIINCEVAEDIAMIAIDSQFDEDKYTDMFTLVKDSDGWKIVSKIYHVKK